MLHPDNERLLTLISEYLCFTPRAISEADVHAFVQAHGVSPVQAFSSLLAARCGLDPSNTEDTPLLHRDFPAMLCCEDVALYQADAYMQRVRPASSTIGPVDLVYETIVPMELFILDDFQTHADGRILPRLGWFSHPFPFLALRENEQVWMTVTPNEINTIQPVVQQSHGKVLTFGLGLGYYAFHCLLKDDVTSVTVVEQNPMVIEVFTRLLLPFFPRQEALHIIQADAFDYAANVMPCQGFDTIFTDLWRDVTDGIPMYRRMKALEVPGPTYHYWMEKTLQAYME